MIIRSCQKHFSTWPASLLGDSLDKFKYGHFLSLYFIGIFFSFSFSYCSFYYISFFVENFERSMLFKGEGELNEQVGGGGVEEEGGGGGGEGEGTIKEI